jgi:hypothetical protein
MNGWIIFKVRNDESKQKDRLYRRKIEKIEGKGVVFIDFRKLWDWHSNRY